MTGVSYRLALLLALLAAQPAAAYSQKDVEKVAVPGEGGIALLRGYESRTGQLRDSCLVPVQEEPERGRGEPAESSYRYVHSMQEVIRDRGLDVSAKLAVGLGVGNASLSVESKFYERNRSQIENGAAYVAFFDYEAATFSNSGSSYRLTTEAQELLESSAKGRIFAFTKRCGDAVVIGTRRSRFVQGLGFLTARENESESERELNVKVAARVLAASIGVGVGLQEGDKERANNLEINVRYIASGDPKLRGATSPKELGEYFNAFQRRPKRETFELSDIYIIPYDALLDSQQLDLGIPRAQARKVDRIVDRIMLLDRARHAARGDSTGAREARQSLAREVWHTTEILRREDGCLQEEFTTACENLFQRFESFPQLGGGDAFDDFVRRAVNSARDCALGYPVTKPNGEMLCRPCKNAQEPRFLGGHEGRCGYVINEKKKPGATRFHLKDLQTSVSRQIEAGVSSRVRVSPNICGRPNKDCGEATARRICQERKFKNVSAFAVWNPPLKTLFDTSGHSRIRTVYANGNGCESKPDAFEPEKCKTFQFIDCEG